MSKTVLLLFFVTSADNIERVEIESVNYQFNKGHFWFIEIDYEWSFISDRARLSSELKKKQNRFKRPDRCEMH